MDIDNFQEDNKNVLHSYLFAQQANPHAAHEALMNALWEFGRPFDLKPKEKLSLGSENEYQIILLKYGVFSLCRFNDDLSVLPIFSPSVVGLIDAYSKTYNVPIKPENYLVAETNCQGRAVSLADFLRVTEECHLWHDVARILAYRLLVMNVRDRELVGVDSYQKVRSLLIEIWAYSAEYRQSIHVLNFIQRRTGLSRSRTLKLLSELKKGGYINIDNGRLLEIKKLPMAY